MKTLYFDCFAGASGDMILGALVAAGVEPAALIEQLELLGVGGWQIDFEKVDRSGISATYAKVKTGPEHAHRHLSDILKIIYDSRLSDSVKGRATRIFSQLAEAEAHVHNEPIEKIHFHEVGALDAVIDVCGAAIGFELLGIERFISSPLRVGKGSCYEGGTRVPLIVYWPGVTKPGSESDTPVMSIDFYPTLLEIVGLKRQQSRMKRF